MSLTAFSFRHYRFVIVVSTAALTLGVLGFLRMPRQEDPTLSAFNGIITVVYPGASVDEIEEEIVEPLEAAVHGLEEVDLVESTARPGFATVNAEFREDADKERAYDLLLQELAAVQPEFPEGVTDIRTFAGKPSNVAVFQIVVHGRGVDRSTPVEWAEELEGRLRSLPDVREAILRGDLQPEVHVVVDPTRLAAAGLTLGQVDDALRAGEARVPGGAVSAGARRLSVRPVARYASLEDIEATVLRTVEGRPVRLADVARVEEGEADPNYLVRRNGETGVSVVLTMKEGSNVFDLAADVREVLDGFRHDLPEGVEASVVADQSHDVAERLGVFAWSLLQGGLIIAIFVAVMAGWRPALAVVAALLLSVGISFWLLSSFGIALQQMSIAGLVVVLGLLVDNAIVVVESILLRRREGAGVRQSAIEGTDRVASAVASSTATTVAAFVPMLLMEGSVGEFTRDIPIVVSVVLLVSLAVALLLTPLLASLTLGSGDEGRSLSPWFRRLAIERTYRPSLERALRAPKRAAGLAFLLGTLPFLFTPFLGMNFFPRAEKSIFLVRVHAPEGTSLAETSERSRVVETWLLSQPEVAGVTANLGEGNPTVYYNQLRAPAATNFAEILVEMERDARSELPELARRARAAFAGSPDVVLETKVFVQGPPVGLPVSLRLYGDDLDRLSAHADRLAAELRRIPGAINVSNGLRPGAPRLDLEVDPVKVDRLGLNGMQVAREVRYALAGGRAAELRRADESLDVVVRVAPEGDERIDDLEGLRFPLAGGGSVPLAQLTRPVLGPTYAEIAHTNLERSVIVGADVDGRLAAEVMADLLPHAQALDLGARESFEIIGEDEERDRAFLSMLTNVVVAMGLIYGILVLQFRSFLHPILIFTSIPIAFGGSVAALFLSGWSFGFTAFIGLLALTGIVVNNAIVLVDAVNQLRRSGLALDAALLRATSERFQPIVLTTATTIAGLLPLTLTGGSLWGPLGWVVIGGLASSTVVTLLLVPTLYFLLESRGDAAARENRAARVGRHGAAAAATLPAVLLAVVLGAGDARAADGPAQILLPFSEVLERLEAVNPNLAEAMAQEQAALARVDLARSTRWPLVRATGRWQTTDDPVDRFGLSLARGENPLLAATNGSVDALRADVEARWVLWDRGRGALVSSAGADGDAARHGTDWTRSTLRLRAAEVYFGLVAARGELAVQEAALEQLRREVADARERHAVGRAVQADVLGLEARAAAVEAARAAALGATESFQAALARLLLLPARSPVIPADTVFVARDAIETLDEALAGVEERADVRASAAALRGAALAADGRLGELWPKVVGSARYTAIAPDADLEAESRTYAASVGVEWTVFRGGGIRAEIEVARAERDRAERRHRAVAAAAAEDVVRAYSRHEAARAQLLAARSGVSAAEAALSIVALRFREGRDTLSRYLEAERAATEARSAVTRAGAALAMAEAELAWAAGMDGVTLPQVERED